MPQFQLLNAETREPLEGLVFNDGAIAAAYVKHNNSQPDRPKLRVDRLPEADVPDRDGYSNGTYRPTPWHNEYWSNRAHYAHLIKDGDAPSLVKFIDPETSRWSTCNPGRFLQRFHSSINVEEWVQRIDAPPVEFKYAVTAEEMIDVYQQGPKSCMQKSLEGHSDDDDDDDEYFDTDIHPVTAYAGFDLQLAYLEDDGGSIYARVLVWPEAKKYGRIYTGYQYGSSGSNMRRWEQAIKDTLTNMGYEQGLTGARMTLIKSSDRLVCPYIDHEGCVTIMPDNRLLLGSVAGGNEISAENTNGYSDNFSDEIECERCSDDFPERKAVLVENEENEGRQETWCPYCAIHATDTNNGRTTGETAYVQGRGIYSVRYLKNNSYSFKQLADGRWFHRSEVPAGAALMENVS
jgi:hypothetical protein